MRDPGNMTNIWMRSAVILRPVVINSQAADGYWSEGHLVPVRRGQRKKCFFLNNWIQIQVLFRKTIGFHPQHPTHSQSLVSKMHPRLSLSGCIDHQMKTPHQSKYGFIVTVVPTDHNNNNNGAAGCYTNAANKDVHKFNIIFKKYQACGLFFFFFL